MLEKRGALLRQPPIGAELLLDNRITRIITVRKGLWCLAALAKQILYSQTTIKSRVQYRGGLAVTIEVRETMPTISAWDFLGRNSYCIGSPFVVTVADKGDACVIWRLLRITGWTVKKASCTKVASGPFRCLGGNLCQSLTFMKTRQANERAK